MKIAAILIVYFPTDALATNIRSYYDHVDKLYVYDNTESESGVKERLGHLPKVEIFQDFQNHGIAKRLNEGCTKAVEDGFDWVLTMDQDSVFSNEAAHYYFGCFNNHPKDGVGMFGSGYGREKLPSTPVCKAVEKEEHITSGMLLSLEAFEKIGLFDEALFIDSVDHEYCVRAQMAGYRITKFNNVYLDHEVGTEVYRSTIKSLFIVKKHKNVHSPLRCYYMYRNMLYLEKKYQETNKPFAKLIRHYVEPYMTKCFLYGRNSLALMKYLVKARTDYKQNKMGKIDKPLDV